MPSKLVLNCVIATCIKQGRIAKTDTFNNLTGVNMEITLRDYFAARAMPLAIQIEKENTEKCIGTNWVWNADEDYCFIAEIAYKLADEMLKARGKYADS